MAKRRAQAGFTLLEAIVAVVITGILAGIIATFIAGPVEGYVASVRRAELTDTANVSLRQMAREVRSSVPNSVRVTTAGASQYLEFLPTSDGGRYCGSASCGDALSFSGPDASFRVLGPTPRIVSRDQDRIGDQIVVFNLGPDFVDRITGEGANAYLADPDRASVRRTVTAFVPGTNTVVISSMATLPFASPSNRFYVVPGRQQAVTYACEGVGVLAGNGTGTLRRYWRYGIQANQPAPPGGNSALLADSVSACNIVYTAGVTQRDATISVALQLTKADETVSLYHEIHVNNVP